MSEPKWTAEQRETVRRMYAEGATMNQIGAAIGTTRSGASGIVSRMNLNHRPVVKRVHPRASTPREPAKKIPLLESVEPPAVMPHLTVVTIGFGQCRYPYGEVGTPEFHFCGRQTTGTLSSWCAHHEHRVWQSSKRPTAEDRASVEASVGGGKGFVFG